MKHFLKLCLDNLYFVLSLQSVQKLLFLNGVRRGLHSTFCSKKENVHKHTTKKPCGCSQASI